MGKALTRNILLILCVALSLACAVLAVPYGGQVTPGVTEHGTGSTVSSTSALPGNVTQTNITGTAITTRWAGFYGFITGGIQLADASNNKFFEWTVTNFTDAVVYAANGTVSTWDLRAMNISTAPYDITIGQDDFNRTFTSSEVFQTPGVGPISGTPYALTYQGGVVGSLKTYALVTSDELVNVWAGVAIQNTTSFKTGQRVDYQIICPAKTAGTTYNFYLELN
jgi:hypothetical protein